MGRSESASLSAKQLWAPWRDRFIYHSKAKGCIFCRKPRSDKDQESLILWRGKTVYTILNLYPYNNGHLMIAPYRHLKNTTLLSKQEMIELFEMANKAISQLEKNSSLTGLMSDSISAALPERDMISMSIFTWCLDGTGIRTLCLSYPDIKLFRNL